MSFHYSSRILCLLLVGTCVAQAPNLLVNGSFEDGPGNQIAAPSTAMTGWTVFIGNIDQVTTWQAPDGVRSLDLNGSATGGVRQVVSTTPTVPYDLTFRFAGNPDLPGPKSVRVSAANAVQVFTFDSTGFSYQNMGWVERTVSFVATSASTTIEFLSLTSGSQGPALDDVRLTDATVGYLSPFGTGCPGTNGTPAMLPNQLPVVGQPFSILLFHLPVNSVGLFALANNQSGVPNGVLSLDGLGMPGCTLYASLDFLGLIPSTGPFGAYVWGLELPDHPQLQGFLFTLQFFFVDAGANPGGFAATSGAIGRIGY